MKNLFLPYYLTIILHRAGFNEPCLMLITNDDKIDSLNHEENYNYNTYAKAILYQQAFEWLRSNYWIDIVISPRKGEAGRNRAYCISLFKDYSDGKGIVERKIRLEDKSEVRYINPINAYNKAIEESLKII